jgi:hypothetical protein
MATFTINFKSTDYRWNKEGQTFARTINNVPANKIYDCIKARAQVFDRGAHIWITINPLTNVVTYAADIYNGGVEY